MDWILILGEREMKLKNTDNSNGCEHMRHVEHIKLWNENEME